jgi:hypothetical protein
MQYWVQLRLGAGFYVVTAVVPPLLVSHALIFGLLIRMAE